MVENKGITLAIVASVFGVLAFITVALRCYTRIRIVKAFGLDDYFMVAAEIFHLWFTSLVLSGVYYGTGRHMWDLTPANAITARKVWWLCYIGYCASMVMAKIAIGLFFLRITVKKLHRGLMWFTIGHTILAGIIFFFVVIFQCYPVSYYWTSAVPGTEGHCIPLHIFTSLGYLYGSVCALGDFTYGILPILLVWNLDVDRKTKFVLAPILGMAAIASCAVLVRMAYMSQLEKPDFLWSTVDIAIWSTVEPGLAIIASSLATLRPLLKHISFRFATPLPSTPSVDAKAPNSPVSVSAAPARPSSWRAALSFSPQTPPRDLTHPMEIWAAKPEPRGQTMMMEDVENQWSDGEVAAPRGWERKPGRITVQTDIEVTDEATLVGSPTTTCAPPTPKAAATLYR